MNGPLKDTQQSTAKLLQQIQPFHTCHFSGWIFDGCVCRQERDAAEAGAGIKACTDVERLLPKHRYAAFIYFLLRLVCSPLCTEKFFSFFSPAAAVSHKHRAAVSIRSRSPSTPPGEPDESCSYRSNLFILHSCLPFLLVRRRRRTGVWERSR